VTTLILPSHYNDAPCLRCLLKASVTVCRWAVAPLPSDLQILRSNNFGAGRLKRRWRAAFSLDGETWTAVDGAATVADNPSALRTLYHSRVAC